MANNGPKSSVLDFNQNEVNYVGWNQSQMMDNIVFYHIYLQSTHLGKFQNGDFRAKIMLTF